LTKKKIFYRKTFLFRSNLYHDHFLLLGARFAVYQSKVGLTKILQNYIIETCEKTPIPYANNPKKKKSISISSKRRTILENS